MNYKAYKNVKVAYKLIKQIRNNTMEQLSVQKKWQNMI